MFIGLSPFTIFLTKFSLWSIVLDLYSRLSLNLYFINVFHFLEVYLFKKLFLDSNILFSSQKREEATKVASEAVAIAFK